MMFTGNINMWVVLLQTLAMSWYCNGVNAIGQPAYQPSMVLPADINDLENNNLRKAFRDVSDTIAEVQKFLEKDPTLPRLTRGEIEELFEKVTKEEYEKSVREGNMNRAVHMKSLMLVLPYNTNNYSDQILQEFYTRPPITKIVNSETKSSNRQQIVVQPTISNNNVEFQTNSYNRGIATTYKPNLNVPPKKQITTFRPLPSSTATQKLKPQPVEKTTNGYIDFTDIKSSQPELTTKGLPNVEKKRFPVKFAPAEGQDPSKLFNKPINDANPKLTPEIQELLQSIGLLTNEKLPTHILQDEFEPIQYPYLHNVSPSTPASTTASDPIRRRLHFEPAVVKANDFETFKPLPRSAAVPETIDLELENLLKSYGILDSNLRGKKSFDNNKLKRHDQNEISQPSISGSAKVTDVDDDVTQGLVRLTAMFKRNVGRSKADLISGPSINKHIKKTGELTNILKRDDANVSKLHLLTDDLEPIGALPTGTGEVKREFKRQSAESGENETTTTTATTTTTTTTTSTTTSTTEKSEPLKVNLDLLASTSSIPPSKSEDKIDESVSDDDAPEDDAPEDVGRAMSTSTTTTEEPKDKFGALDLDPVTEEPLPPPRRNGFYFFSDWNSFLEVGEEPDQVVVRFDPKVGDPSRFIPVKIP